MNEARRTPSGDPRPSPHYLRLARILEARRARPFGIMGELSSEGVVNDYWNVLYPTRIRADIATENPTADNLAALRDALRSTRTYEQYCIDRWRFEQNPDLTKIFDKIILPALLSVPNTQILSQVVQTYTAFGESDASLTPAQIAEITELSFKAQGAIFGQAREAQARD
jgi:hypothetical protein